jgi:hypothetical protein
MTYQSDRKDLIKMTEYFVGGINSLPAMGACERPL